LNIRFESSWAFLPIRRFRLIVSCQPSQNQHVCNTYVGVFGGKK
jgi:hypothetical protein